MYGLKYCILLFLLAINSDDVKQIKIVAEPGKTYYLQENVENTRIIITGQGSVEKPFVISGLKNNTKLSGSSHIYCKANNVIIQNISFVNNNISYKGNEALIKIGDKKLSVKGVTVKDCDFIYSDIFPDKDKETQFFWIKVTAENTIVDNCVFEGKQNRLPIIHVDANKKGNIIKYSTFKNVKSRKGEALEAIRVGLTDGTSGCKILNNKFINYHGDSETVSCKADDVVIEGNEFIDSRSGVSLRWADNCVIKNNQFLNTVSPIRISGSGHVISGNRFEGKYTRNISLMKGAQLKQNEVKLYKPAKNIIIEDNTFNAPLELRLLEMKETSVLPDNIVLKNNSLKVKGNETKMKNQTINSAFFSNKNIKPEVRKDNSKVFTYPIK